MFAYIYIVCAFYQAMKGENWILKILAINGRMSLTGYMGSAFVYYLIFHYPGLGLYMKYGAAKLSLIALITYLAFSVFSVL